MRADEAVRKAASELLAAYLKLRGPCEPDDAETALRAALALPSEAPGERLVTCDMYRHSGAMLGLRHVRQADCVNPNPPTDLDLAPVAVEAILRAQGFREGVEAAARKAEEPLETCLRGPDCEKCQAIRFAAKCIRSLPPPSAAPTTPPHEGYECKRCGSVYHHASWCASPSAAGDAAAAKERT